MDFNLTQSHFARGHSARMRTVLFLAVIFFTSTLSASSEARDATAFLRYNLTYAGFNVGEAQLRMQMQDSYELYAEAELSGLLSVFLNARGFGRTRGHRSGANLVPADFYLELNRPKRATRTSNVRYRAGDPASSVVSPAVKKSDRRILITTEHKRNVVDPLSALIGVAANHNKPIGPQVCRSSLPIYDGKIRFELKFEFKRMETFNFRDGTPDQEVVVCQGTLDMVAGHIPRQADPKEVSATLKLLPLKNSDGFLAPVFIELRFPRGTIAATALTLTFQD